MANFHSEQTVPTQFPMNVMYENVTICYNKLNENNDVVISSEIKGTGNLYITTDLVAWIKNSETKEGFDFYLSDISKLSKENNSICMLSTSLHFMIKLESEAITNSINKKKDDKNKDNKKKGHKKLDEYETLERAIKLAKDPVIDEFSVEEIPKGTPVAENIKFEIKPLDYHRGSISGKATLYFTEKSLELVYNKEGSKLGSGYELKDITVEVSKKENIIKMKGESTHFSIGITLMPEDIEKFNFLCKKIEDAGLEINEESTDNNCSEVDDNSENVDDSKDVNDSTDA